MYSGVAFIEPLTYIMLIFLNAVSRGPVPDLETRGPGMPDPETFPYEWLRVRQCISMPCFMYMYLIGKHFNSCREYLKECHKINKIIYLFHQIILLTL